MNIKHVTHSKFSIKISSTLCLLRNKDSSKWIFLRACLHPVTVEPSKSRNFFWVCTVFDHQYVQQTKMCFICASKIDSFPLKGRIDWGGLGITTAIIKKYRRWKCRYENVVPSLSGYRNGKIWNCNGSKYLL